MDKMRPRSRRRAVGYVRVSDLGGESYQKLATRQIDLIDGWLKENGADVLDWFFDLGVEATEPLQQRPAGIRLLDRVRYGDLNFVVVASLDAFGKAQALLDALELVVGARHLGVVAVLPDPREELDFLGLKRIELAPTIPLEPQVGPEVLN